MPSAVREVHGDRLVDDVRQPHGEGGLGRAAVAFGDGDVVDREARRVGDDEQRPGVDRAAEEIEHLQPPGAEGALVVQRGERLDGPDRSR